MVHSLSIPHYSSPSAKKWFACHPDGCPASFPLVVCFTISSSSLISNSASSICFRESATYGLLISSASEPVLAVRHSDTSGLLEVALGSHTLLSVSCDCCKVEGSTSVGQWLAANDGWWWWALVGIRDGETDRSLCSIAAAGGMSDGWWWLVANVSVP